MTYGHFLFLYFLNIKSSRGMTCSFAWKKDNYSKCPWIVTLFYHFFIYYSSILPTRDSPCRAPVCPWSCRHSHAAWAQTPCPQRFCETHQQGQMHPLPARAVRSRHSRSEPPVPRRDSLSQWQGYRAPSPPWWNLAFPPCWRSAWKFWPYRYAPQRRSHFPAM